MSAKERATNGLKLLFTDNESFTQVQAAWRFLNNKNVSIEALFKPITETLESEITKQCSEYVLAMSDWSHLDYKKHTSKKELMSKNKKGTCKQIGYDLQTTLAVSDKTGEPIAPIVHNLKSSEKVYSTYDNNIVYKQTHLQELATRAQWIDTNLKSNKKVVHIVDREADSVAFMRTLSDNNSLFLLRVKDNSKLYYPLEDTDINQKLLADKLPLGEKVKTINYRNKKTTIYVNECDVEVRRDATKFIVNSDGKKKLQKIEGVPLKVRFIVERLVDENDKVVAKWLLITNIVDKQVTTSTLATWYYYRWKIESYFKLLKSSGFNLEAWQQIEPEALFKRLLVVSYSCVLVWKIANDSSKKAQEIRKFLVMLSGKQLEWGTEFTYPALLSGLESYIQIMDVLLFFSHEELLDMKKELSEIMGMKF